MPGVDNERKDKAEKVMMDPHETSRQVRAEQKEVLGESLKEGMWSDTCSCNESQSVFLIQLMGKVANELMKRIIPLHFVLKEIEERYGKEYANSVKHIINNGQEWPVPPSC